MKMKKNVCKHLALVMALVLALSLTACAGETPAPSTDPPVSDTQAPADNTPTEPAASGTDWSHYTEDQWQSENWDSKTISYQFTGEWSLPENDIYDFFLINLYSDGSVLVDQYQYNAHPDAGSGYQQFGYWSEENTDDGNEISLDTVYCTPNPGDTMLVDHEYHYDLYEESDGGYSFGYTFGISAGAYFRDVDVEGSAEILYASIADFHAAMDAAIAGAGDDAAEPEQTEDTGEGEDAPAGDVVATYEAGSLVLTLYADGTMLVEFPQYSMSRDGFTYELSEDGTTLTVTGTPDEEAMGAFGQVWDATGSEVWTIDGTTATPIE